jgi:hypothetical protein
MKSLCAAIVSTVALSICIPGIAAAQLAQLEPGGAPASVDALPALGAPADAGDATSARSEAASRRQCEDQVRSFRARNTQSPSRREQALEKCYAAARAREHVTVAGE